MKKQEKTISISTKAVDTENKKIINNKLTIIQKHEIQKGYLILSKNDFGKNKRANIGLFNKKTNFIVSNEKSLFLIDENLNFHVPGIDIPALDKLIKSKEINNYYLLYSIPIKQMSEEDKIYKILIDDKIYNLDYNFGFSFGVFLNKLIIKKENPNKLMNSEKFKKFKNLLNNFGSDLEPKFEFLVSELTIQSNEKFIFGLFAGLTNYNRDKLIFNNFNLYHLTSILNTFGASYSVRKINDSFHIRFKFPAFFDESALYLNNIDTLFRFYYPVVINNKIQIKQFKNLKEIIEFKKEYKDKKDIIHSINSFNTLLIPCKDLVFIEQENIIGYDFVSTQEENYNNYLLMGQPLMKNSDGDILAVVAIDTPQAAKQADEKFGIFVKENHLSFITGKNRNWIGHDAVLGLYNFTK